ncbi:hypothetical protein ACLOJK_014582, partial [Asimina triloba]
MSLWLMQDLTVNRNGAAVNLVLTQLELGGHGRSDLKTHLGFFQICVCLRSRLGGAAHLSTLLIMGVGGHRFCLVVAGVRTRSARFAEDADLIVDLEMTLAAYGSKTMLIWVFFGGRTVMAACCFLRHADRGLVDPLLLADEEDGRPRSAGFPLVGGGLRGGSMGKMGHWISVLR